jgi:hypothetical protein
MFEHGGWSLGSNTGNNMIHGKTQNLMILHAVGNIDAANPNKQSVYTVLVQLSNAWDSPRQDSDVPSQKNLLS